MKSLHDRLWLKENPTAEESYNSMLLQLFGVESMDELTALDMVKKQVLDKFQSESGNPYIRILETDTQLPWIKELNRASFSPNPDKLYNTMYNNYLLGLSGYGPGEVDSSKVNDPDTLNVFEHDLINNLIAEYPHAYQYNEKLDKSKFENFKDWWKDNIQNFWFRRMPKKYGYGEPIYNIPGTVEHDAHSVREPELRKEYGDALSEYINQRYATVLDKLHNELGKDVTENLLDVNLKEGELQLIYPGLQFGHSEDSSEGELYDLKQKRIRENREKLKRKRHKE